MENGSVFYNVFNPLENYAQSNSGKILIYYLALQLPVIIASMRYSRMNTTLFICLFLATAALVGAQDGITDAQRMDILQPIMKTTLQQVVAIESNDTMPSLQKEQARTILIATLDCQLDTILTATQRLKLKQALGW